MKFELLKNILSKVLLKTERVAGKNPSLKILECVLLSIRKNTLTLSSTNLDLGVRITVPVKNYKDGDVAVPAAVFSSFVSQIPDNTNISFEVKDNNVFLETKTVKTIIKTQDHKDFPIIPKIEDGVKIKVPSSVFLSGLKSVCYSSATSSMKPELSSVYISNFDDGLVFVGTDSFRLAEKKVFIKDVGNFGYILLPFKNTNEIIKLLDEINDVLEININKNQISILVGDDLISSRVVDGSFPDYKQILPKEYKTEVVVLKQDMINAMKLSNIFTNDFNQININIDKNKKLFSLNTENQNIGKNTVLLDAVIKGEDLSVNFNHKYIMDCFQSITADSVSLGFNGLHKPILIKGVGDKSFTYMVMPMNK